MKLFDMETNPGISAEECAAQLVDTVPLVTRTIRAEMRRHRGSNLSVPQFRTLAYIGRHPGTSLSGVADHIGLTRATMSKMIDRLKMRDLVVRQEAPDDRRRICLELTPLGLETWQTSRKATRTQLAAQLTSLSPEERVAIVQAMETLRRVFGSEPPVEEKGNG